MMVDYMNANPDHAYTCYYPNMTTYGAYFCILDHRTCSFSKTTTHSAHSFVFHPTKTHGYILVSLVSQCNDTTISHFRLKLDYQHQPIFKYLASSHGKLSGHMISNDSHEVKINRRSCHSLK